MSTCAIGHDITSAFAFCACTGTEHFLWGHTCADGRYWAHCPARGATTSGIDWKAAASALGGYWR